MTTTEQTARSKSVRGAVFDMVRSLGLIAVVVAISLLFVPGLLHPSKSQKLQGVDYTDVLIGFHQVTGKPALAPVGLPASWKATSRGFTDSGNVAHLHIGFAAPNSKYAGLEEGNAAPTTFIRAVLGTRGLTQTGSTTINGTTWSIRTSQRGETSLTHTGNGVTAVITGSATLASDKTLAASLRRSIH